MSVCYNNVGINNTFFFVCGVCVVFPENNVSPCYELIIDSQNKIVILTVFGFLDQRFIKLAITFV